jgi:D-2-hydroxyacid dehydrogenase (NADP+)
MMTQTRGRLTRRLVLVALASALAGIGLAVGAPTRSSDDLLYLAPSLPEEDLAALRRSSPKLEIRVGLSTAEALAIADEVDGIDGRYCTSEFLQAASSLRWVQSPSAGVERYLRVPELLENPRITLTNMQGVHGPTIADHVFGMLLTLTRDLSYYTHPNQRGTWKRGGSGRETIALEGRTLFVVGLGGIGREVAKRGHGFGMRVIATRRSEVPPPPYVDEQGTSDRLGEFLGQADVVVLCVPLTAETTRLIGAEELAAMKPGSYLVNIARGRVVDTDALVAALERGHLAGAGLDVTDPEPLPADHVLWTMPNVVITPHVASRSALTRRIWRETYVENLRRFAAGEPLVNVVDKAAGY